MLIKLLSCLAILVCLMSCTGKHGEPLNQAELNRQLVSTAITAIDWRQTHKIIADPTRYEYNPILGRYPSRTKVDTYFAIGTLAQWATTYYIPHKYRKTWQYLIIGAESAAICNNYYIGIRIDY